MSGNLLFGVVFPATSNQDFYKIFGEVVPFVRRSLRLKRTTSFLFYKTNKTKWEKETFLFGAFYWPE